MQHTLVPFVTADVLLLTGILARNGMNQPTCYCVTSCRKNKQVKQHRAWVDVAWMGDQPSQDRVMVTAARQDVHLLDADKLVDSLCMNVGSPSYIAVLFRSPTSSLVSTISIPTRKAVSILHEKAFNYSSNYASYQLVQLSVMHMTRA